MVHPLGRDARRAVRVHGIPHSRDLLRVPALVRAGVPRLLSLAHVVHGVVVLDVFDIALDLSVHRDRLERLPPVARAQLEEKYGLPMRSEPERNVLGRHELAVVADKNACVEAIQFVLVPRVQVSAETLLKRASERKEKNAQPRHMGRRKARNEADVVPARGALAVRAEHHPQTVVDDHPSTSAARVAIHEAHELAETTRTTIREMHRNEEGLKKKRVLFSSGSQ